MRWRASHGKGEAMVEKSNRLILFIFSVLPPILSPEIVDNETHVPSVALLIKSAGADD